MQMDLVFYLHLNQFTAGILVFVVEGHGLMKHFFHKPSIKNHICFENTPRRLPEFLLWQVHPDNALRSQWNVPMNIFDLVTLTFDL